VQLTQQCAEAAIARQPGHGSGIRYRKLAIWGGTGHPALGPAQVLHAFRDAPIRPVPLVVGPGDDSLGSSGPPEFDLDDLP